MAYYLNLKFGKYEDYLKVTKDIFYKILESISEVYVIDKDSVEGHLGTNLVIYKAVDKETKEYWYIGFIADNNISNEEI